VELYMDVIKSALYTRQEHLPFNNTSKSFKEFFATYLFHT